MFIIFITDIILTCLGILYFSGCVVFFESFWILQSICCYSCIPKNSHIIIISSFSHNICFSSPSCTLIWTYVVEPFPLAIWVKNSVVWNVPNLHNILKNVPRNRMLLWEMFRTNWNLTILVWALTATRIRIIEVYHVNCKLIIT